MRVVLASHTKIQNWIAYDLSSIWGANILMGSPFKHETSSTMTVGLLQLAWETSFAATLHEFTSATAFIHINVHAWYSSSNQCLPIWVINLNWTSEHHCLCYSAYTQKSFPLISPLVVTPCPGLLPSQYEISLMRNHTTICVRLCFLILL